MAYRIASYIAMHGFMLLNWYITCCLTSLYSAVFDYEERTEYSFFLAVEDDGRTGKRLSETVSVTISVGNLNDQPTMFTQSVYSKFPHNGCLYEIYLL